jgi:hypothetical protein
MAQNGSEAMPRVRRSFPALLAVTRSYALMFRKGLTFLRIAIGWAILGVAVVLVLRLLAPEQTGDASDRMRIVLTGLVAIPTLFAALSAGVANSWHRAVLFERWNDAPLFELTGLLPYVGRGAVLTIGVVGLPWALINGLVIWLFVMATPAPAPADFMPYVPLFSMASLFVPILVAARLSLVLPAAAIGERLGFVASWRSMRGSWWRFLGGALLVCGPVLIAGRLATNVVTGLFGEWGVAFDLLRAAVVVGSWFVLVGLAATYLSLAYRFFVQGRDRLDDATVDQLREHFS